MDVHNTLQAISLGTHLFEGAPDAEPMLLMEVMPSVLAKRGFSPPDTACRVTLGYRDAPEPGPDCVIVFSKVRTGHWYTVDSQGLVVEGKSVRGCAKCWLARRNV